MKILFLTGSLVHGGAERHTIGLANRLAGRGHDCHLVYVKNASGRAAFIACTPRPISISARSPRCARTCLRSIPR
jgi:hypothetical protein